LHSRGLILVKVYCLIIFFVATFLGGISPYFYRWNETFLLLGTQFAAGVFLATALIHFLSDSTSTFAIVTQNGYPLSFMLAAAGYMLTMFGDVVIAHLIRRAGKAAEAAGGAGKSVEEGGHQIVFVRTTNVGDTILLILALCFHSIFEGLAVGISDTKSSAWKGLWVILLHKVFAAIAMGIALLKMLPTRPFLTTAAYSFIFAISSPIGVGIGIALDATTEGAGANWTYAISMGIACGVFIFVAVNHLIAKGYKPQQKLAFDTPFYKFFAVLAGVTLIAIVMIWD
ncbi:hypothetical protein M569_15010, partial [Genlisea aurea]